MQEIKRILKSFDTWLHDLLIDDEDLYFRNAHASLPNTAQDFHATLDAIHTYDIKRFGTLSQWRKVKKFYKSKLYTVFIYFRKLVLTFLHRIFLFRDRVLRKK